MNAAPDRDVMEYDVAIVGAGYTGLWTAYYLLGARPGLRVVVVESHFCGFGASGRNGGWVSAKFPGSRATMAADHGRRAVIDYQQAMFDAVDEIGRVAAAEAIEADYRKAGMLLFATSPAQEARLADHVADLRRWGYGAEDLVVLGPGEARARAAVAGARAAMFTPHCAAVHPWRLVAGLAAAVERRGGVIYEHSPVRTLGPGLVVADEGAVRAPVVLRCTEAFTTSLPGSSRLLAPIYSLMIATEPLPAAFWDEIGIAHGQTFTDYRHLLIYGQRTADDRLVFGGRGAPYHFGSRVRPDFDHEPAVHARLWSALRELFPALEGTRVTHAWGGALGVPRDWCASVGLDRRTGLGWAGGYVGDGVSTTNLAGRTLRDLVLGRDTELTRLPWVDHRSPTWEPEPLRWLGINTGLRTMGLADVEERLTHRPSRVARLVSPLVGGH